MNEVCEEVAAFINALPEAIRDPAGHLALSKEAHRLAGSAGVFGARRLATHLQELEQTLKAEGVDPETVPVDDITACWRETVAVYRERYVAELV